MNRASKRSKTCNPNKRFKSEKLRGLKVLDLGCLEGGISIPLAKEGCKCIGVDVRERHLIKANFAAEILGISKKCKWSKGDVTKKDFWKGIGRFDIIICSGLLYHIDAVDIIPLLRNIHRACKPKAMIIVDTNISLNQLHHLRMRIRGIGVVTGKSMKSAGEKERNDASWSSYENNETFWLTEEVLQMHFCKWLTCLQSTIAFHEWGHQSRDIWLAYPSVDGSCNCEYRNDPDTRDRSPGLA